MAKFETVVEQLKNLTSAGQALGAMENRVSVLRSSIELVDEPDLLRQRMEEDGYLYLPGLLNKSLVSEVRQPIIDDLVANDYLDSAYPPDAAVLKAGCGFSGGDYGERPYPAAYNLYLQQILSKGALPKLFSHFLEGEVKHFDRTLLRARSGDQASATYPHCDAVFMGRGTKRLYTAWIPLGDVPLSLGGLMILEKSHKNKMLRLKYSSRDVDDFYACSADAKDWVVGDKRWDGKLSDDPSMVQAKWGGRWLTAPFQSGDVVLFSIYTVHASADNCTNRIRLSIDARYLSVDEVMDERWMGVNSVGHSREAMRGLMSKKGCMGIGANKELRRDRLVIRGGGAEAIALGVFFAGFGLRVCFVLDRPDFAARQIEAELAAASTTCDYLCSASEIRDHIELRVGYRALHNINFYIDGGDELEDARFEAFCNAADYFRDAALAFIGEINMACIPHCYNILGRLVEMEFSGKLGAQVIRTQHTKEKAFESWLRVGATHLKPDLFD